MNEFTAPKDNFESSACKGAFLPLVLVGLSLAIVLLFQVSMQLPQREMLKQIVKQNEKGVEQSQQVQGELQKLVMDFNAVAPDETKAVLARLGVQWTPPASPAPSPSSKP